MRASYFAAPQLQSRTVFAAQLSATSRRLFAGGAAAALSRGSTSRRCVVGRRLSGLDNCPTLSLGKQAARQDAFGLHFRRLQTMAGTCSTCRLATRKREGAARLGKIAPPPPPIESRQTFNIRRRCEWPSSWRRRERPSGNCESSIKLAAPVGWLVARVSAAASRRRRSRRPAARAFAGKRTQAPRELGELADFRSAPQTVGRFNWAPRAPEVAP